MKTTIDTQGAISNLKSLIVGIGIGLAIISILSYLGDTHLGFQSLVRIFFLSYGIGSCIVLVFNLKRA